MGTEYDYQRECDDIDDFNREEAMKKKAEISHKLHSAAINKASLEVEE